ncbi:uncharacterized protein CIMG_02812 [Coccidioides immitis RS]|uniref:Cytochrome P450 n=1 Tax=Coccidioides immitis (strain RS) TaxID=246410 RepID=J3KM61_COCIM|nr:uncharacterized protein CIMG_02812 [Coccidioides immitis RS]EAS37458.3 hypothetical protein CIMG_02812 [Coccidioides immitis RS]TPX24651.1 hypothetical protein DIZ76_010083 [Coccidioides immitis]
MALTHRVLPFSAGTLASVAVSAALGYLIYRLLRLGRRPAYLPPGPQTQAIWGNLKQCDPSFPQHQYADWALTHGPVYTVMQGDTPQIIVNRAAEARDVFVKQGAYTQNRPPFRSIMLLRDGYFPSLMNGSKWQNARKMWQVVLSSSAIKNYIPYQELESEQLLLDTLNEPLLWYDHLERFANSVGMVMVNGYRITSSSDPIVKETVEDLYDLSRVGFSGNMLDFWPFLERVVWTLPIYKVGRRMAKKHKDYIWKNYFGVKQRAEQGTRLPSFNRTIQERLQEGWTEVSELEGAEIGQHLLSGSTDTVVSTLTTCIAALCLFPDVQRKAQEEIDRVVGPDRLPRGEDEINLPYIQQLLLEAQRWCPAMPLCVARVTSGPVSWGKYNFPENTGLTINTYAIHNDPELYPEPHIFMPERWEGRIKAAHGENQLLFTFGAGRRFCPGKSLAEKSLFIAIARWLWAFNTSHATDEEGNKIPIDPKDLRPGNIVRIKRFSADVQPRNPQRAGVIRRVWREKCDTLLDENHQWKTNPERIAESMKMECDI